MRRATAAGQGRAGGARCSGCPTAEPGAWPHILCTPYLSPHYPTPTPPPHPLPATHACTPPAPAAAAAAAPTRHAEELLAVAVRVRGARHARRLVRLHLLPHVQVVGCVGWGGVGGVGLGSCCKCLPLIWIKQQACTRGGHAPAARGWQRRPCPRSPIARACFRIGKHHRGAASFPGGGLACSRGGRALQKSALRRLTGELPPLPVLLLLLLARGLARRGRRRLRLLVRLLHLLVCTAGRGLWSWEGG